ncbi:hypothetical protein FGG78_04520 [Thioclava sp. BHET1]|nr:hypothetical protein FGG78_04520 [Thioclava sp. BHET1]
MHRAVLDPLGILSRHDKRQTGARAALNTLSAQQKPPAPPQTSYADYADLAGHQAFSHRFEPDA